MLKQQVNKFKANIFKTNTFKMMVLAYLFIGIAPISLAAKCQQTLTLGLGNIWPPYYFLKADANKYAPIKDQVTGIDIDIVKHIFQQANICLAFVTMPSSTRAFIELKKGKIDFLYGASYSKDRANFSFFSFPYRQETVRIFWSEKWLTQALINDEQQTKDPIKQYEKLLSSNLEGLLESGLTGTINNGSFIGKYSQLLKEMPYAENMYNIPTIDRRMKMLQQHRVNFTIEDQLAGQYYLKQHSSSSITMHPFIVYQNNIALMFSKKSVSYLLVEQINKAILQSKNSFPKIIAKYR